MHQAELPACRPGGYCVRPGVAPAERGGILETAGSCDGWDRVLRRRRVHLVRGLHVAYRPVHLPLRYDSITGRQVACVCTVVKTQPVDRQGLRLLFWECLLGDRGRNTNGV